MFVDRVNAPLDIAPINHEGRSSASTLLPNEIWDIVVELATEIPGVYNTEDYAAIAGFSRGRLSRVSKYWNNLMQRFLVRYIRIHTGEQACDTAMALRRLAKHADPDEEPGRWTLRVEVALDGIHEWTQKHTNAMRSIFNRCPNIVCFSTVFSTADPYVYSCPTLITWLSNHQHLKRLELKFDKEVLDSVVQAVGPALQVLWLYPCRRITRDREIGRYPFPSRPEARSLHHQPFLRAFRSSSHESQPNSLPFNFQHSRDSCWSGVLVKPSYQPGAHYLPPYVPKPEAHTALPSCRGQGGILPYSAG